MPIDTSEGTLHLIGAVSVLAGLQAYLTKRILDVVQLNIEKSKARILEKVMPKLDDMRDRIEETDNRAREALLRSQINTLRDEAAGAHHE